MTLPVLALTLGDVAGIGPEITAKTLLEHDDLREECVPVVSATRRDAPGRAMRSGSTRHRRRVIDRPRARPPTTPAPIELIQTGPSLADVPVGELSPAAGDGSYRFVVEACRPGPRGRVDGIVTAPLNKAAMHAGGHNWPGHTELLAHEFGVENFCLVLSAGDLYFFHLTAHVSLRQAIEDITPDRTDDVLDLAGRLRRGAGQAGRGHRRRRAQPARRREPALRRRGRRHPGARRRGRARARGINAHGPLPADALIPAAVRGKWNIVVACYHDQGHAPFKAVYGDDGVNITVGLPVVRVSVDHGTAFDIAGKGIAREASLVLSLRARRRARPRLGPRLADRAAGRRARTG